MNAGIKVKSKVSGKTGTVLDDNIEKETCKIILDGPIAIFDDWKYEDIEIVSYPKAMMDQMTSREYWNRS